MVKRKKVKFTRKEKLRQKKKLDEPRIEANTENMLQSLRLFLECFAEFCNSKEREELHISTCLQDKNKLIEQEKYEYPWCWDQREIQRIPWIDADLVFNILFTKSTTITFVRMLLYYFSKEALAMMTNSSSFKGILVRIYGGKRRSGEEGEP